MKLMTVTNVSLEGVTQGHRRIDVRTQREAGVPEEEGSGGFERFGWGPPLLDDEASTFISQTFQRADAFLFGRRTYEIFAGSWGAGMDPGNPVGEALNTRPSTSSRPRSETRNGRSRLSCPVTSRRPSVS
jgi:dihydrofolate reductase